MHSCTQPGLRLIILRLQRLHFVSLLAECLWLHNVPTAGVERAGLHNAIADPNFEATIFAPTNWVSACYSLGSPTPAVTHRHTDTLHRCCCIPAAVLTVVAAEADLAQRGIASYRMQCIQVQHP